VILEWVSFLTYPNLFGIKRFVVVIVEFSELHGYEHGNGMREGEDI
jgi:hypothetical protein